MEKEDEEKMRRFFELQRHSNFLEQRDAELRKANFRRLSKKPIVEKKPCDSLTRARAFFMLMLPDIEKWGKNKLKANVKKYFPEQSEQTVYVKIRIDGLTLADKEKYKSDYDYALKLFNEIKP